MRGSNPIYVEIRLACPIEVLWERTQNPSLHALWDLRFTSISYQPKAAANDPQRFLYSTRLGFGLRIDGEGESTGECTTHTGEAVSALRFWSHDQKSLIREGSGYWKYIPDAEGVRFITLYDYKVRFGIVGRAFDRLIFRPMIGWATAWSFDRLRLWIEQDLHPRVAARLFIVQHVSRWALALIFFYHGLVPKILLHHADELRLLTNAGVSQMNSRHVCTLLGVIELLVALMMLWRRTCRLACLIVILAMPIALLGVALTSPNALVAAFNPVTLNLAVCVLAIIAMMTWRDSPTAARCLRAAGGG